MNVLSKLFQPEIGSSGPKLERIKLQWESISFNSIEPPELNFVHTWMRLQNVFSPRHKVLTACLWLQYTRLFFLKLSAHVSKNSCAFIFRVKRSKKNCWTLNMKKRKPLATPVFTPPLTQSRIPWEMNLHFHYLHSSIILEHTFLV